MCQIFAGPVADVKSLLLDTPGLIENVFAYNSDGVGYMYAAGGRLVTQKIVPATAAQARVFIESLPDGGSDAAVHFRMTTHGDTDHTNAHPYPVVDGVALIHNGILSHGNAADRTKSDTWHYTQRLAAQLAHAPGLIHEAEWRRLVEKDIGEGNRFVLMDSHGIAHILNRDTGLEKGSVWVANTYSFDAGILWPEMAIRQRKLPVEYMGTAWDDWHRASAQDTEGHFDDWLYCDLWDAIVAQDVKDLTYLLDYYGVKRCLTLLYDGAAWIRPKTQLDSYDDQLARALEKRQWGVLEDSDDPDTIAALVIEGTVTEIDV